MNILELFLLFILNIDNVQNTYINDSDPVKLQWMSSNFGSSFAAQPYIYDINNDGYIDLISVSVDGEVSVYDARNGESLSNTHWPIYLSNDHFFSRPIVYIHGGNIKKELIVLISQKGRIYYLEKMGMIVKTEKLKNLYLRQNWGLIQYKELSEIISTEKTAGSSFYELYPEVYADVTLVDLSVEGILNDIIIPVSFVTEESGNINVIVSAIVVFNMASGSAVDVHLISISKRDSEYPGYLLASVEILRDKENSATVTVTSGIIYRLTWNKDLRKFHTIFNGHVTYNQGPDKCHLTGFCSNKLGGFLEHSACCVYGDFYGHFAMIDLIKHRPLWEYNTAEVAIPTDSKFFVDGNSTPYVVFGNSEGWIHCVSLLTGTSKESFPLLVLGDSFSSTPEIVSDLYNQLFVILLSEKGHLYMIPTEDAKLFKSVFFDPHIVSYIPLLLLSSNDNPANLDIIIHSKNGFIFKLEIPNFKKKDDRIAYTSINGANPSVVGTLYGVGSTFSFDLTITDHMALVVKTSPFYVIKVFVNEHLYSVHRELSSGDRDTRFTMVIDLDKVNRTLMAPSVFVFGTVTIVVSDPSGRTFKPHQLNVRLNYDFQFELIWIVYLTFFICCASIVLFHLYDYNDKLHIPVYATREK